MNANVYLISLLVLNVIMNIFVIIGILDTRQKINQSVGNKNEKNIGNNPIVEALFDKGFYHYNTRNSNMIEVIEGNVNPRRLVRRNQLDEASQACKYDAFKDVYDFLDYVSDYNLKIVDIKNDIVRKVMYLDKCVYNNRETVLITFDDNTQTIFRSSLYARYATA